MFHLGYKTTWVFVSVLLLGALAGRALVSRQMLKTLATLKTNDDHVLSVAFSPDGHWLAAGLVKPHSVQERMKGSVRFWRVGQWRDPHDLQEESLPAVHVSFSPDAQWLAVGYCSLSHHNSKQSPFICIYDSASLTLVQRIENVNSRLINAIAFSPDSKLLCLVGTSAATLWDAPSFREKISIRPKSGFVRHVCFSADSTSLFLSNEGWIRKYEISSGDEQKIYYVFQGYSTIGGMLISPDCKTLFAVNSGPELKMIDVASGRIETASFKNKFVRTDALALSSSGRTVAQCTFEYPAHMCHLVVHDTTSNKQYSKTLRDAGRDCSVSFSPDDELIAVGTGRQITIFSNPFK